MSKKRKNFIRLIAVFVTVIILCSVVRVGMYYIEYRQEKAVLQYLRENKNNSPIRELVTAKGKPYQKSSIKYDIDGDGEKKLSMQDTIALEQDFRDMQFVLSGFVLIESFM